MKKSFSKKEVQKKVVPDLLSEIEFDVIDEDDREDYNFPEINSKLVFKLVKRNEKLYEMIKKSHTDILTMWCTKVRPTLAYLKKPFLVWAKPELES